ncbi:MAG: hypothetical protein PHG08_01040 [Bacilli bacterium]|nr:hypothetical protein [Bacilli bacterium]
MKTTKELKKILEELKAEKITCEDIIKQAQVAENRLIELNGSWGTPGEIKLIIQAITESKYPVIEKINSNFSSLTTYKRIIDIDDKWIYIKKDGYNEETLQYSKTTGRKKNSRDNSYTIDHLKAIEIWTEHINNNLT